MPTLLSINNYHYRRGGADTIFFEQNRLFEEFGWSVVPFSMKHNQNFENEWSDYFIEEIEFGKEYSLFGKLRNAAKIIYSLEARRKLDALIDCATPDIAHLHNVYHHISPSVLSLLSERGIPSVMTLHDLKIACPAYKMLASDGICERCKGGNTLNVIRHRCIKDSAVLSSLVFLESTVHRVLNSYRKHVARFIVPSRFYREKLIEWGWPAEKFEHVPNFVDSTLLTPRYSPGRQFLYFGRLGHEKGLATLVKACARAKVRLHIAGTGPEKAELQRLAQLEEAEVNFLGYLTGAELHAEVASARAVVLPSEWYENAPVSVLEAYALGKPVIGANIGGIPELIRPNETGFIFPSGSIDALSATLQQVANTPDAELAEMGRQAREWVEREFTAERYRDRLLQIYGVLDRSGSPQETL